MLVGYAPDLVILEFGISLELLNNSVVVVGNGESRSIIDLNILKNKVDIIGCNALHRDICPKYLVCCDKRMADESTLNPALKNSTIFVRDEWFHYFRKIKKNKNIKSLPKLPFPQKEKMDLELNWGSGSYAVLIAAEEYSNIYLLGFDLYSKNKLTNNVYKDTENYKKSTDLGISPIYWIYQLSLIFKKYPEKNFFIINDSQWIIPAEWNIKNVHFLNILSFEGLLLNNKSV
jgi:hypothetical protein